MPLSVGPETPTESNLGAPTGGISYWWRVIGDWIKALSPAGSTEYDTGWINITLAAGYATHGLAPAVRRIGRDVELRGMVRPDPAGNFPATATVNITAAGGIPSGMRPISQHILPITGNSSPSINGGRVALNPDGSVQLFTGNGSGYYSLFGIRYKVD